ncbi:hypothetical protein SAMN04487946_10494 [Halobellus clavatus]|uniref:Uncharacterized protein n=2 Tax=Halobellus clavatus TaxID=660517 RepID=A0A1H3FP25_9EURY|nr:hypothetical protein SAMN04487946_10494 [Halobellus clavatus]
MCSGELATHLTADGFKPSAQRGRCMAVSRRQRFVHAQVAAMLAVAFVLSLLDSLTGELFFVVSLIAFLVNVELTAPFHVTPRWRRRLRWVIALGLIAFGYIVVQRILTILPPGVF